MNINKSNPLYCLLNEISTKNIVSNKKKLFCIIHLMIFLCISSASAWFPNVHHQFAEFILQASEIKVLFDKTPWDRGDIARMAWACDYWLGKNEKNCIPNSGWGAMGNFNSFENAYASIPRKKRGGEEDPIIYWIDAQGSVMKNSDGSLFDPNKARMSNSEKIIWKTTHFQRNKTLVYSDAAYFAVLLHHLGDFSVPAGHCPGCNECKDTKLEFQFELQSDCQEVVLGLFSNLGYEKYDITLLPDQIYWDEYVKKFKGNIETLAKQMTYVSIPNPIKQDPMPDMYDFISEPETPWDSHFSSFNNRIPQLNTILVPSFPDAKECVKNSVALALLVVPIYLNYFLYPEYKYSRIDNMVNVRFEKRQEKPVKSVKTNYFSKKDLSRF